MNFKNQKYQYLENDALQIILQKMFQIILQNNVFHNRYDKKSFKSVN